MNILYRTTGFSHVLGSHWVEALRGTLAECEDRERELQAKGFSTSIVKGKPTKRQRTSFPPVKEVWP